MTDHDSENPTQCDRVDFLWHVHGYLNEQVRFADTKATAAAAFAIAGIGALHGSGVLSISGDLPTNSATSAWVAILSAILFAGSAFFSAIAIVPTFKSPSKDGGLIFWGALAGNFEDGDALLKDINSCDAQETALARHVVELACIARTKFRRTRISVVLLIIAGVCAVVAILTS